MAEVVQVATINEMLGRFIEDSVNRAIGERLLAQTEEADRKVKEMIETGTARLDSAMQQACGEIQTRIRKMVEEGLGSLTSEGERLVEHTCGRIVETAQKVLDELPVTIQESAMEMNKENETLFRRRCEEWIVQLQGDSTESMVAALKTQLESLRHKMLEETAESAKAICDRNLFDVRSEFENHVNRCFQGMADRLSVPLTLPVTTPVMRQ
jgi:hypothetical protein